MPYILASAVVAWIAEGFGTGFVTTPVAAVLFLQGRAWWGRQWLFRIGAIALLWHRIGRLSLGSGIEPTVRSLYDAPGTGGAPCGKWSDGPGRARASSSRRAGSREM